MSVWLCDLGLGFSRSGLSLVVLAVWNDFLFICNFWSWFGFRSDIYRVCFLFFIFGVGGCFDLLIFYTVSLVVIVDCHDFVIILQFFFCKNFYSVKFYHQELRCSRGKACTVWTLNAVLGMHKFIYIRVFDQFHGISEVCLICEFLDV